MHLLYNFSTFITSKLILLTTFFSKKMSLFVNGRKLVFETLKGLRGRAVWAYKTSEKIGEDVLAYDPVPAEQKGCIPLSETNGKAWSL